VKTLKLTLIGLSIFILLILILYILVDLDYKIDFFEVDKSIIIIVKKPDGSIPGLEGDKHNLLVYENKLFGKKLLDERFWFRDGLMVEFDKDNIHIELSEKSAVITIHGSKMDDKVYTCYWD